MERKHKIIVSIVGIFIILLALVGITYGYFLTRIEGNTNDNSIYITTSNLRLVYSDDGDIGTIEAYDIEPGELISEKRFTVTNEGNADVDEYRIYLENVINTFVNKSDVKLTITCSSNKGNTCLGYNDSYPVRNSLLISNSIEVGEVHTYNLKVVYEETYTDQSDDMGKTISGKIQIYNPKDIITIAGTVENYEDGQYAELHSEVKTSQILYNAVTGKYEYIFHGVMPGNHEVYIKSTSDETEKKKDIVISKGEPSISSDGTSIVVGDLSEKADVDITILEDEITLVGNSVEKSGFTSDTLAYKIIETAKSNLDGRTVYSKNPLTNVAEFNSVENEATLSETEDDYTETTGENSYYFRGNVQDNYVNFAGMCWRIIRIEGDGAIKLILEDKDAECNSEEYTGNFVIGKGLFGTFNSGNLTYLDKGNFSDFSQSSFMSSAFKNFQTNELSSYLKYLKHGNWCLDDTAYADSTVDLITTKPLTKDEILLKYSSHNNFYYDSYVRLFGNRGTYGYSPTLNCNGTVMNDFEDSEVNPTLMYVGGITADEVAYTGGKFDDYNRNYYLMNDYLVNNSLIFFTLSPCSNSNYELSNRGIIDEIPEITICTVGFDHGNDRLYFFGSMFIFPGEDVAFRPVITLKPGTDFVAGLGTKSAPYVIEKKVIKFSVIHWCSNLSGGWYNCGTDNFKAINGMTWEEWATSSYNNGQYSIVDGYIKYEDIYYLDAFTKKNDIIIANYSYTESELD